MVGLAVDSSRTLRVRRSDDGGVTFGPEVTITSVQITRDPAASSRCGRQALKGNIRTFELPAIAVDRSVGPTKGSVYVVYQSDPDGDGPDISDVFFTRSADGGLTGSQPIRVNDDETITDQWMPFVGVTREGTIYLAWGDNRSPLKTERFHGGRPDPDVFFAKVFMPRLERK